jgi:membrane protein
LRGFPRICEPVFTFATTALDQTKKGWVAGIGVIVLFWSVIKVLGSIEESFNDIWNIPRGRTLFRKIADYLPKGLYREALARIRQH